MSKQDIIIKYNKQKLKRIYFIVIIVIFLLVIAHLSLLSGSAKMSFRDLLNIWTGNGDKFSWQILVTIRLPRILGALLAGVGLAVSGAVIQSLLRNPLASPFTLGISGSSAFGAAFAIVVLGAGSNYTGSNDLSTISNPYIVAGSAFIFSIVSISIILLLSRSRGATPEIIILSGIIISSLFGAGISAMQYFADDVELASIIFWTFGDLGRATWQEIIIQAILLIPALLYFMKMSWNYKSLQSGDEYAKSIGVNPLKTRLAGMVFASLVTAVIVSFYGVIAFIGLVVPHIVRRIIGGDETFLIPASALFGGAFLLLADTLARTVISPVLLPVGILTSFLGAPVFLFLLVKNMGKR